MSVRTRFAPSPTGLLHIGGVRTALFNWLLARHQGGKFILRIDDTDQERHVETALAQILEGFRWIGIDWDEGPEVGGDFGPYFQSQRADRYRQALDRLIESGQVYRDYSTDAERAAERAEAEKRKIAYRFRRKPLTDEQIQQYESEGRPYALRFEVTTGRPLVLQDLIRGEVQQSTDEIGDFVIARQDGSPLYNFATVVDDLEMKITHVVRAEEHLTNTFPQLLLFEALGGELPTFAHVPYVAEPGSKSKLSKRKTEDYEKRGILIFLQQYIDQGYLPDALLNYLARLGWSWDDSQEIFSRSELIEKFSLDRVNSSPAGHDPDKLFWIEGEWMKSLSLEQKVEGVIPFLVREGLVSAPVDAETRQRIALVIEALGDRLKVFSDIVRLGSYFFSAALTYDPDAVKKRLRKEGVPEILADLDDVLAKVEPFDLPTLEAAIKERIEAKGYGLGKAVNALRVAITGQGVGPGLYDCLVILGRDVCRERVGKAQAMLLGG